MFLYSLFLFTLFLYRVKSCSAFPTLPILGRPCAQKHLGISRTSVSMSNRFVYIVVLLGLSHSFHHLIFANGHPVEYWACYLPSVVRREPMFQRDTDVSKSRCYSQNTKSIVFMSLHFYSRRFIYLQCALYSLGTLTIIAFVSPIFALLNTQHNLLPLLNLSIYFTSRTVVFKDRYDISLIIHVTQQRIGPLLCRSILYKMKQKNRLISGKYKRCKY